MRMLVEWSDMSKLEINPLNEKRDKGHEKDEEGEEDELEKVDARGGKPEAKGGGKGGEEKEEVGRMRSGD